MQLFCYLFIFVTIFLIPYRVLADDDDDDDDYVMRLVTRSGQDCVIHLDNRPTDIPRPQPGHRQRRNANNTTNTNATTSTDGTTNTNATTSTDGTTNTNATTSTDDECKFIKSLVGDSEINQLYLQVNKKQYQRDDCVYWEITVSSSEVLEVRIPAVHSLAGSSCKDGYLKILDDDCDLTRELQLQKRSNDSTIITKGSDLMVYFRPGYCTAGLTLSYRSVPKLPETDKTVYDSGEEDDSSDVDDTKEGNSTGSIVGAVIGSLLAVLLVVLVVFFVRKWLQRSRGHNSPSGEERVTVHFWSKPSGYATAAEVKQKSSRDDLDSNAQQSTESLKKSFHADPEIGTYSRAASSSFISAPTPVPPPYSGPSTSELFHYNEELPPSYVDAVRTNH